MINHSSPHTITTLEEIALRKEELRLKLEESKLMISDSAKEIFMPNSVLANSSNALMRNLGTGMMVFNGVKTGIKVVRMVRAFFKR